MHRVPFRRLTHGLLFRAGPRFGPGTTVPSAQVTTRGSELTVRRMTESENLSREVRQCRTLLATDKPVRTFSDRSEKAHAAPPIPSHPSRALKHSSAGGCPVPRRSGRLPVPSWWSRRAPPSRSGSRRPPAARTAAGRRRCPWPSHRLRRSGLRDLRERWDLQGEAGDPGGCAGWGRAPCRWRRRCRRGRCRWWHRPRRQAAPGHRAGGRSPGRWRCPRDRRAPPSRSWPWRRGRAGGGR